MLPLQGNLSYDPITSRVVVTADCATGEVSKSDEPLIPYLPYPTDPRTGAPIQADLQTLERRADLRFGAPMFDPITGLTVPICAMTIHPTTGAIHPLGKFIFSG